MRLQTRDASLKSFVHIHVDRTHYNSDGVIRFPADQNFEGASGIAKGSGIPRVGHGVGLAENQRLVLSLPKSCTTISWGVRFLS